MSAVPVTRPRADTALRWAFGLALVAFVVLSALDVVSTAYGTARGGVEINPLVRLILQNAGPWGFAALKATTAGAYLGLIATAYLILPGRARWLAVAVLLAADCWLAGLLGHNAASLLSLLR